MVVFKMRLRVKNGPLHKLGFVHPPYFYTPWWTPQRFCLVIVQEEPICSHQRSNSVQAVGHAILKCFGLWRTTNTKNLGIIRVSVRHKSVTFHQLQYVSDIQDEQNRPEDRPLRHAIQDKWRGGFRWWSADVLTSTGEVSKKQTSKWQFLGGHMTSAAAGEERRG